MRIGGSDDSELRLYPYDRIHFPIAPIQMSMKRSMRPFDAAWFFIEKPDVPGHFGPLIVLSRPPDASPTFIREWVDQWRTCRVYAPPFNYRLARGRIPRWEVLQPEQVDLDYHFRHSALPEPGGERELGVLISRLQSHKLDRRRPLWECHVIEGLEHDRFAIYLKLHHGQFDGVGTMRLLRRTFSTDPDARQHMPPWAVGMHDKRDTVRKPKAGPDLGAVAMSLPRAAGAVIRQVHAAYVRGDARIAAPFQAPKAIFNGRVSAQRRFATQCYPLGRFKAIAQAANVSINDVFLSISGGALRRYLLELDALPSKSLVGIVPVNLRAADDASVGNQLSFIYASLHSDKADPIERLRAVHASTSQAKAYQESLPSSAVAAYGALLSGPAMGPIILGLGGHFPPAANLIISNVPGPRERLHFNGARVEQIYGPSVLFHGQALNITMSSYVDEANLSFTGCRDSLPSMQHLAVYAGEALDSLESAMGLRSSAEPART